MHRTTRPGTPHRTPRCPFSPGNCRRSLSVTSSPRALFDSTQHPRPTADGTSMTTAETPQLTNDWVRNDPSRPRSTTGTRARDGSWGMIPLLVLVVALLGLGYFAYDRMHDAGTTPRSTRPRALARVPPRPRLRQRRPRSRRHPSSPERAERRSRSQGSDEKRRCRWGKPTTPWVTADADGGSTHDLAKRRGDQRGRLRINEEPRQTVPHARWSCGQLRAARPMCREFQRARHNAMHFLPG